VLLYTTGGWGEGGEGGREGGGDARAPPRPHLQPAAPAASPTDQAHPPPFPDPPPRAAAGSLPGASVLTTVDFGPGWYDLDEAFGAAEALNPKDESAFLCSEFYTGWLTHWGERAQNTSLGALVDGLQAVLTWRGGIAGVSLYMAAGGTNFGWTAGAAADEGAAEGPRYAPCVTSYDYTAPVGESGATGQPGMGGANRFEAVRAVLARHAGADLPPTPPEPRAAAYGRVALRQAAPLLDAVPELSPGDGARSRAPAPMEALGQAGGLVLYSTRVPPPSLTPNATLTFACAPHDVARVLVGGRLAGVVARGRVGAPAARARPGRAPPAPGPRAPTPVSLALDADTVRHAVARAADGEGGTVAIDILVEAVGRDNGGVDPDLKGLPCARVTLNGEVLHDWRTHPLPLAAADVAALNLTAAAARAAARGARPDPATAGPVLYKGYLTVDDDGPDGAGARDALLPPPPRNPGSPLATPPSFLRRRPAPADTYLSLAGGWTKGVVFVNGFNLGWHWAGVGPGDTLYVPGPVLRAGANEVVVLEVEGAPSGGRQGAGVESVDAPAYGPPPAASGAAVE